MKILIVDDNDRINSMLSKYLRTKGYDCITSNTGRNGLRLIKEEKFDAVLLDLYMPEFSGYHVIDALEKEDNLKDLKIIVFTASDISSLDIEQLLKRGVHGCIKKPVQLNQLLQTLSS